MKKWVQSFTVLCLIALAFVLAPRMVLADDHGTTGDCTWTYEEEKRLLTISGTGAMADYGVGSATTSTWEAPWHKYCQMLETIHIEDGVWYIGEYAFAGCFGVEDVAFGDSVQRIGAHAFEGCSSFECPWFPNSLRVIDDYAFAGCTNMFTVSFPDTGVVSIGAYAFVNTPSLTGVRLPDSLQTIGEYAFGYVLDPNGTGLVRNTKFARITSASKVAKEYADQNGIAFEQLKMGGQTGSCTWEYDPSTKTLTISGEGGMENYAPALSETTLTTSPWDKVRREIEHVVIEEGVTGIGDYAFTGINFGDAWITTPHTTKRIGVGAFSSCGTTAGIDVKGNSCTIEKEAFAGVGYQKALEKISLSGVKYISEGAFQNTDSREVVFDGGIKEIGKSAFAYNKAVTEMELPESCTYLANAALEGCEKLAKLTIYNRECLIVKSANVIPEGTAIYGYRGSTAEEYAKSYGREFHAIGVFSFDEATWTLTINEDLNTGTEWEPGPDTSYPWDQYRQMTRKIVFAEGVTMVGAEAFHHFSQVREISLPESLTTIYPSAFYACSSLENVDFPDSVTRIGYSAFDSCTSLTNIVLPGHLSELENGVFMRCGKLTSVTLPEGLCGIGDIAFRFTKIESVDLPATLESIGRGAFLDTPLRSITIPRSVSSIGINALGYEVKIPGSVSYAEEDLKRIDDKFFIYGYGGTAAQTYAVQNGFNFEDIGACSFDEATGTLTIYVDKNIESGEGPVIGEEDYPWRKYQKIVKKLVFSDGVTLVGTHAFNSYTIEEISFPDSMTHIYPQAFMGCTNLKALHLPDSLTTIGKAAFRDCGSLTEVAIPSKIDIIDENVFYECTNLTKVTLPQGLRSIGELAFRFTKVASINLPEGLEDIGSWAFLDTSLRSVTIPKSVTSIGHLAFGYEAKNPNSTSIAEEDLKKVDDTVTIEGPCTPAAASSYAKDNGFTFVSTGSHAVKTAVFKATPTKDGRKVKACTSCGKTGAAVTIPKVSNIALSATSFVYNKGVQRPSVIVKDSTGKALATSYYTLTWSNKNSTSVGKYSVRVTLKGSYYSGSKTMTYTIVPPQVKNLAKTKVTTNGISLSWTKTAGASKYLVQWSKDAKNWGGNYWTTANTYSGTSFNAGTGYYFRVQASNKSGEILGAPSANLYVVTLCTAPVLQASSPKAKTVKATWKKVTGAKKYVVYASTSKDSGFKPVKTVTGLNATFTVQKGGVRVYVKVRAVNSQGAYSAYSNRVSVVVKK